QADFEYYVNKVLDYKPQLKEFQGELRGGRYTHLLSGVFSARMWIKQRNTAIEYLYEKYSEPLSAITWVLDKNKKFRYPKDYLITGLKWLQKNAPHDSICGCSIDEVHNEMVVRFDWAEQIANEVYKSSFLFLSKLIEYDRSKNGKSALIVFNPLPWKRRDKVEFSTISHKTKGEKLPHQIKIIDHEGNHINSQYILTEEEPRYSRKNGVSHKFTFLAEVPACGYKTYHIVPIDEGEKFLVDNDFKITRDYLENKNYRIDINPNGFINVYDKETGIKYENVCEFEDAGDWGDEYDYSGPLENQIDLKFSSGDATVFERSIYIDGPTHKCFKLQLNLKLPYSLTEDRYNREDWLVDNRITILISLYKGIKRIDFQIELENNSRDHRIRVLFPTNIKSEFVNADGHFYVVQRDVKMPEAGKWVQKPLPTNHQKDFVSVSDKSNTFAILNKGLPEYEAIINQDDTITFAITLLRCVEWLSRDDFITRKSHAGPGFKTPGAQCLGKYRFELSIITESKFGWLDSHVHVKGKEFNNPLKPLFPNMVISAIRSSDKIILRPSGIISYYPSEDLIKIEPYLPPSLSFLEIDNKSIVLSAMKKAEIGNFLIIRLYNISSMSQKTKLSFNEKINIKKAELVNFLEETPQHEIKASIINLKDNIVEIGLEPHVIATLKFECEF
ncbi:MAG: glycoside hydrolase family 38 C-terminal domain-containing protein, partial [Promethearchaeota archaeon]